MVGAAAGMVSRRAPRAGCRPWGPRPWWVLWGPPGPWSHQMGCGAAGLGAALAAPARHKGGVPGRRAAFPQTSSFQKIFKNIKKITGYIKKT